MFYIRVTMRQAGNSANNEGDTRPGQRLICVRKEQYLFDFFCGGYLKNEIEMNIIIIDVSTHRGRVLTT
ncbi:hypothetical protein C1X05_01955 [Laceyella sacchari]|nr:hypothetical protein C1X05_01955 [Laceyella sacchari]